jgi:enediyne biosynthesis protein E4
MSRPRKIHVVTTGFLTLSIVMQPLAGLASPGGVTFTDIAAGDGAGITYRRAPTPEYVAIYDALKAQPIFLKSELPEIPFKDRGAPGVAILDYDSDGDLDIYATNGPGAANSLYSNRLRETGTVSFVDVAASAGVAASDQDSTGVCYGDLDNDDDPDLLVLGNMDPNRLYENRGNGTFRDISMASGVGNVSLGAMSCAMGDIDNDGRLDIAIVNGFDRSNQRPIFTVPYAENHPNQLLRNLGGNRFEDVSASSGFLDLDLPPGSPARAATISWAVAMVDIDLDGDVDIVHGDDSGQAAPVHGFVQLFENDGTGHFTNRTMERGLDRIGFWMGFSFADFNSDGRMDLFSTSVGNHFAPLAVTPAPDPSIPDNSFESTYFLQNADGTFTSGPDLVGSRHWDFGWGTSAIDYDNDADTDIVYHGGMDQGLFVLTTPGLIMENDGEANFSRDFMALAGSTNHVRRTVDGVATGDLDGNGFDDIVSVSEFDLWGTPLTLAPPLESEFDVDAYYVLNFTPVDPDETLGEADELRWTGVEFPHDGTLSVELNGGENRNRSVQIELMGSKGLIPSGRVNRDGIGAVIEFTPRKGEPVLHPVLGGSSYASQNSLIATLGLGRQRRGTLDVLWPGGVRNRLYDVKAGEMVRMPEIPCSYDSDLSFRAYKRCVEKALGALIESGAIKGKMRCSLLSSALRAYREARADEHPGRPTCRRHRPCDGQKPDHVPGQNTCSPRPHRPCDRDKPGHDTCSPRPHRPCDRDKPGHDMCSPRPHRPCDHDTRHRWRASEAL